MVHGRKVAGILAESAIAGRFGVLCCPRHRGQRQLGPGAVGRIWPPWLPASTRRLAAKFPREDLLRQLLQDLDVLCLQVKRGQSPIPEWRGLLETIGQRVDAVWGSDSFSGVAEGIDGTGALLLLRQDDGQLVTLTAGDVTLGSR